jgi:hypothetical protein
LCIGRLIFPCTFIVYKTTTIKMLSSRFYDRV